MKNSLTESTKGLSTLVSFALLLTILTAAYTYYQVYGIPKLCEQYEVKSFMDTLRDFREIVHALESIELSSKGSSLTIRLGGSYPSVPFFSTLPGFSGSVYTYPAEVRILNAVAIDSELRQIWNGDPVIWTGSSLEYDPSTYYSNPGCIRLEYGVVAFGKQNFAVFCGKIIDGKNINLLILKGNASFSGSEYDLNLYPYSGGGTGITITDNGKPIQIFLKTKLPINFWKSYFSDDPYVASVTRSGDFVVITLVKGVYYHLNVGVAALQNSKSEACYLYRVSSKVLVPPSQISVKVRDEYNNPVSGTVVRFFAVNGRAMLTNGTYTGSEVTAKSRCGVASVVVTSGNDVVIAELVRSDGTTYDLTFNVLG